MLRPLLSTLILHECVKHDKSLCLRSSCPCLSSIAIQLLPRALWYANKEEVQVVAVVFLCARFVEGAAFASTKKKKRWSVGSLQVSTFFFYFVKKICFFIWVCWIMLKVNVLGFFWSLCFFYKLHTSNKSSLFDPKSCKPTSLTHLNRQSSNPIAQMDGNRSYILLFNFLQVESFGHKSDYNRPVSSLLYPIQFDNLFFMCFNSKKKV